MITVVYLENALTPQTRRVIEVESNTTINEVAPQDWVLPYVAFVNGKAVLRKDWDQTIEGSLAFIEAGAIPQGGGGGTDPLRMVLMIAVMAFAGPAAFSMFGAGAGLTGAALAAAQAAFATSALGIISTAAITMVGMAVVNALVPVQAPTQQTQQAMSAPSPTYSVQAQGNAARLEAAIPEHFGRLRCFPDLVANPYTEFAGNEQYLYQLLCIGRGAYSLEDIKLEDALLANFDEASIEIIQPYGQVTLFPAYVSVVPEVSGQELSCIAVTYSQSGSIITVTVPEVTTEYQVGKVIYLEFTSGGQTVSKEYTITVPSSTYTTTTTSFRVAATNSLTTSGSVKVSEIIGPFIINSEGSTINKVGIDIVAPNGLFFANDDGSLSAKSFYISVIIQKIDDLGNILSTQDMNTGVNYSAWSDWTNYVNPALQTSEYVTVNTHDDTRTILQTSQNIPPNTDLIEYRKTAPTFSQVISRAQYRTRFTFIGITYSANTNTPQRYSNFFDNLPAGRYQVKVRRIDVKDTNTRAGHTVIWAGARGYHPDDITKNYGDTTLLAIKIRATNNISAQSSRKVNVVATRLLPVWNGTSWSANTATRSPAWALAYACKQIGLTDQQIDLPALLALHNTTVARGDYFDGRFDNFLSFWEAATRICGAVRTKPYIQGGILRIMRDQATTIPVAMFSTRNIIKNSLSIDYLIPNPDTAELIDVKYFDNIKWQPSTVSAWVNRDSLGNAIAKPSSIAAKIDLFGVTGRDHAFREGLYQAATNKYRRKLIKFQTEMEGFIPSFGDLIIIQHDMPGWGQSGEVIAWDSINKIATLSENLTYKTGTHYIGLRARDGSVQGPYAVTQGPSLDKVVFTETPPNIYVGGEAERTHYSFGWADTWRQPARVLSVRPENGFTVSIECINEDSNVHTIDQNVITPVVQTSQLDQYTNAPRLGSFNVIETYGQRRLLKLSWQPTPWATGYIVESSKDGVIWDRERDTDGNSTNVLIDWNGDIHLRVAAYNVSRGPWVVKQHTLSLLENVTGLGIVTESSGMRISWNNFKDVDGLSTEIRMGASWETGVVLTNKNSTSHLLAFQTAGSYTIWAKYNDIYKASSAAAATLVFTVIAPSAVTIEAKNVSENEILSWSTPTGGTNPIKAYEIRWGNAYVGSTFVAISENNSYTRKIDYTGVRKYWVTAIDVTNIYGTTASKDKEITIPSAPTLGVDKLVYAGGVVSLKWALPSTGTLDIKEYVIKYGNIWNSGTLVSTLSSTSIEIPIDWFGGRNFLIAAIDMAGNLGPASLITTNILKPVAITGLTNSIVGKMLSLTWDTPIISGGTLPIKSFEIKRGASWETGTTISVTSDTKIQLEIDWKDSATFFVSAIDINNKLGETTTRTVSSIPKPSNPVPTAIIESTECFISWNTPLTIGLPISRYEIKYSDTAANTWEASTYITEVTGTQVSLPVTWIGTRYFKVAAVDTSNNISTTINTPAVVNLPNTPTFNSIETKVGGVLLDQFKLTWNPTLVGSSRLPIDHYVIGYDVTTLGITESFPLATISATSYIAKATWTLNRIFWVQAVDTNSNISAKAYTNLEVFIPSVPTNLSIQVVDNNVLLYWAASVSTLPVISYEITRNDPTFNKSNSLTYIGEKSGGFTTVFETESGTYTYYIRAINSAGTTGTYSQGTVVVAQPPDYILNVVWNSTFNQTKSNAYIEANGSLIMPVNTTETWAEHFGAPNNFGSPQGQITASGGIYQYYAMPTKSTGYYEEVFNYGTLLAATKITVVPGVELVNTPLASCTIEVSTNGTTWAPAITGWAIYATSFQYVRIRITVTSTGNDDLYTLKSLLVTLDSKLKNDAGTVSCISTDVGGTTVNFSTANPFVDITSITVTPLGTSPLIAMYDFVDTPNPTGFKVLLFTTAGVRASGTVSWSVKGY